MIKYALIQLIKGYSFLISPIIGRNCRFHPTCSSYMQQAIEKYGTLKGGFMGLKRLGKCHPWHNGDYNDPLK